MGTDFKEIFQAAKRAVADLAAADDAKVSDMLRTLADETDKRQAVLLDANKADLEKMDKDNPMYDRLRLDGRRLDGIAADMRNVAGLPSPVGRILSETVRPNGMKICKVSVPFGVVGIIYEARPNVSFDVFSLCVKSGNACILKGGSDAFHTNSAIVELIRSVLRDCGFDEKIAPGSCRRCGPGDSAWKQTSDRFRPAECQSACHRNRRRNLPYVFRQGRRSEQGSGHSDERENTTRKCVQRA